MKSIIYKEEGVASAVGTIFAILIFVTLLGIVITTYVPATMTSYEEQYSEGILNSMVQLESDISYLVTNYKPYATLLIPFDLSSNYVPLFSSATFGTVNITPPSSLNSEGSIDITYFGGASPLNYSVGGSIQVFTNNRYFVDQEYVYEYSSLIYDQVGSGGKVGSLMASEMLSLDSPVIESTGQAVTNITITLINIVGGPLMISSGGPVTISIEALSKNVATFAVASSATLNIRAYSSQGLDSYFYNYLNTTLASMNLQSSFNNGIFELQFPGSSGGIVNLQIFTILVSQSQF